MELRSLPIVLISAVVFSACSLLPAQKAGIHVVTNLPASVALDGKEVGQTPYDVQDLQVKKYSMKLSPSDSSYATYQTTVQMSSGVQAAVDWSFGKTTDDSSGIVLELQPSQKKGASELEVVTTPDNVPVVLNNESKGFSPLVLDDLTEGQYTLSFQAPGYEPFTRAVNVFAGKRVVVQAKLAKKPNPTPTATSAAVLTTPINPTPTPNSSPKASSTPKPTVKPGTTAKPYVEILETPTGFLRVRDAPATTGKELGQLNTGDTAPYAGETQNNWYKITFKNATSSAWVSGQYAKLQQ